MSTAEGLIEEESFWALAAHNPIGAMRSPLFSLLTLTSPQQWLAIETTHLQRWIEGNLDQLTPRQSQRFVLDCIAHYWGDGPVGHFYNRRLEPTFEYHATDYRIRDTIAAHYAILDKLSPSDPKPDIRNTSHWQVAQYVSLIYSDLAKQTAWNTTISVNYRKAACCAGALVMLCISPREGLTKLLEIESPSYDGKSIVPYPTYSECKEMCNKERKWQWGRLVEFIL